MSQVSDDELRRISRDGPQPGEVYRHYAGSLYVVVGRSFLEDTCEPLVTYKANVLDPVEWTRTLANFTERVFVRPQGSASLDVRRFERVGQ